MTMHWPAAGVNDTNSYLTAGVPWLLHGVLTTVTQVTLPYITNTLMVRNIGTGSIQVGFSTGSFGANKYFTLTAGQSVDRPFRVNQVWLNPSSGIPTFEIVAGLTLIDSSMMTMTGSAPDGHPIKLFGGI